MSFWFSKASNSSELFAVLVAHIFLFYRDKKKKDLKQKNKQQNRNNWLLKLKTKIGFNKLQQPDN